jgi:hypothetical protein
LIVPIIALSALGGLTLRSRKKNPHSSTRFFGAGQTPRVTYSIGPTYGTGSTAVPAEGGTDTTKYFYFYPYGWGWWPWWYNPYYQTSYAEYSCLRPYWVHLTPIGPLLIKFPKKSRISPQSISFVNIDVPTQRRVAMLWAQRGLEVNMSSAADIAFSIAGCSPNYNSRYDIDVVRSIRDIGLITQ